MGSRIKNIIPGNIRLINKAVFIGDEKILVIGDLHLGYEDQLTAAGIYLPRIQLEQTLEDLEIIFKETGKVKEVVLLGDVKDAFGSVLRQEWKDAEVVIKLIKKYSEKIVVTRGNHDVLLKKMTKKLGVEMVDFYFKSGHFFMHGDIYANEVEAQEVKNIFLGHQHPAISMSEGVRVESYKCYLVGKWRGKRVYILPSFFPLVEGYDTRYEKNYLALPLKFKDFEVYAVGDDKGVYGLGKMGKI
mgnify:CR=1 FL=1